MMQSEVMVNYLEKLTGLLKVFLTAEDEYELYRNIYHIKNDCNELNNVKESLKNTENTNNHELAARVIVVSGRCFGDVIQELQNIRDVLKDAKKQQLRKHNNG